MTLENFEKILDWLKEISDVRQVQFVGGEPTTLLNLDKFLDSAKMKGFEVIIYTNGAFNEKIRLVLSEHLAVKSVIFHYGPLHFRKIKGHQKRFIENIGHLSKYKYIELIYAIDRVDFEYQEILEIAKKFGAPIRWIFTAPTSGKTHYIGKAELRECGRKIEEFLLKARDIGVKTKIDITVPLCLFSSEFFIKYKKELSLYKRCIPFVYIKPDLSTQFCTAMPRFSNPPTKSAEELREVIKEYRKKRKILEHIPSFEDCKECDLWQTFCQGGCLTYKIYK